MIKIIASVPLASDLENSNDLEIILMKNLNTIYNNSK